VLLDANYHPCPYDHSRAHNHSLPDHDSLPHNYACTNDQSLHLQNVLLSNSIRLDTQA
jgi:hypothetical protein